MTQLRIARRAGVNVSTVNKILNKTEGAVFKEGTVRRVIKAARELGFNFAKLKFAHYRRHPRKRVLMPIELIIYDRDGSQRQAGTAIIHDISLSGAQLGGIVLPQQVLPMSPHVIGIRPLEEPLKGIELRCRPVRFLATDLGYDLGVEFLAIEPVALAALRKII